MKMKLLKILKGLFDLGLFGGFFALLWCSLMGALPDNPIWIGIYAHFKFQYGLSLFGLSLLFLLRKKKIWVRLSLLLACFNLIPILASLLPYPNQQTATSNQTYRIMGFNVLTKNSQYQKARNFIQEYKPDLILMTEYTPIWHEEMEEIWRAYPYRKALPRHGFNGSIIASKHPFLASESIWFGPFDIPSVKATVKTPSGTFELIAIHPPSPPNVRDVIYRNQFMDSLSNYVSQQIKLEQKIILAGDFNNTPYHPRFRKLLSETGLKDSRQGFGNQATFPQQLGWFGIPLDHILYSEGIMIKDRKVGRELGSDHRPVLCDFTFAE
ncbi:MAG: endonuclease/exonuclease/phosphatase family protein [Bacteroidia bacterium]|nr:endonuclease/exonuclease/phosphatase family protein [Bacteroidia bacterium]